MKMLLMMTVLIFMTAGVAADPNNETVTRAHAEIISQYQTAAMERLQVAIEQRQQKVVAELLLATQSKPLPVLATMDQPVVAYPDTARL